MLSKMSSVIKFEFHVAMKGIHDWFWAKSMIKEFHFKINWHLC